MPVKNYNRPAAHQTISTPINMGFAGSLQARSPAFFTMLSIKQNYAHHETIVIGTETFQFVDPAILNQVSNDAYIAVKKINTPGKDFLTLSYALGRYTAAQAADMSGFAPFKIDGITAAKIYTASSFVVRAIKVDATYSAAPIDIPAVRQYIVMDKVGASSLIQFTTHDLVHIGSDIYEALNSGGSTGDNVLTNNSYIPFDIVSGASLAELIELAAAVNGTRLTYTGAYFQTDGITAAPFVNGTKPVKATVVSALGGTGVPNVIIINDALAPGNAEPASTSTALTVTFPSGYTPNIILNTFGASGNMKTSVETLTPYIMALVVVNGQGTLGPNDLAGGDQILSSGHDQIPASLSNNNGVLFDSPYFEHDMSAISRLADSGDSLTFYVEGDADERPTIENIGHLFRVDFTPDLALDGTLTLATLVTPIHGDLSESTDPFPTNINIVHDENMDTWQTEKGRARQDFDGGGDSDDSLLYYGGILGA